MRRIGTTLLVLLLAAGPAALGADVVHLSSSSNAKGRTRLTGKVVDYTGRELVLEAADGRQRKYPGAQVVQIESAWTAAQQAGDDHYARREFREALVQYQAAMREDPRRWVQRMILARMVVAHRELEQLEQAGALFLVLVRDDPATPYFAAIPLGWLPAEPAPGLEQKSLEWLKNESSVAGLLGASHLLPTAARGAALERLAALARDGDPRVSSLARAQSWRAHRVTAAEQPAAWLGQIEEFPADLRAGAYLVVGRGLADVQQHERAALALLRVPIVYPRQGRLAAEALVTAAGSLEKVGQASAAPLLYRESLAAWPEGRPATVARQRLEALGEKVPQATTTVPLGTDEPPSDERFLDGLRQRRLFELAELYCRTRLERSDLPDEERAMFTVELSRSLVDDALASPADEREAKWQQALGALDGFDGSRAQSGWTLLLQVQSGLVKLARGELARQEAEIVPDAERLEQARDELRSAIAQFKASGEAIAAQLRRLNQARRSSSGEPSAVELGSLARHASYHLARAYRSQGQSYPARSADRTNSLRQAVELLSALAQSDELDDVSWNSRLDEIICFRLLEDYRTARQRLALLAERQPPPAIELGARAQLVRLALDQGQLDEALAVVSQGRTSEGRQSPELDYALLETYMAAWRAAARAEDRQRAASWQAEAAELVRDIDRLHGPYWSRRAETLLARSISGASGVENASLLIRAAESLYRTGRIDEALQGYDRALEQASLQHQEDVAFQAGYAAATIEQERKNHRQAARRFRQLAMSFKEHSQAGEAHLLAIFNAAQAAGDEPQRDVEESLELVREHLDTWPQAASANQARLWQGRLHQQRGEWAEAIAAFETVDSDHAAFDEALRGMGESYARQLEALKRAGKPTGEAARQAADRFEKIIAGPEGRLPEEWTPAQKNAAVAAARLLVAYGGDAPARDTEPRPPHQPDAPARDTHQPDAPARDTQLDYARVERILSAALSAEAREEEGHGQDAWRLEAEGLLAVALAGQGRRDEAGRVLERLAGGSPGEMLVLVESMQRLRGSVSGEVRHELAELELRVGRRLFREREALSEADRARFDEVYLAALSDAGRREEALETARLLAKAAPRDGHVQELFAQLLLEGSDDRSRRAALEQWRLIQRRSRPGSDRWLRATYHLALAHDRLGERDQAVQLIKLAQAQYPELGGAELKRKFLELFARGSEP